MSDVGDLTAQQAGELIAEVEGLRERVRRAPGPPWFPLVLFGALTIAGAALSALHADAAELPLWGGAGIAGMWLTGRHYARHDRGDGPTRRDRRTVSIAVALFCVCIAAAAVSGSLGGARAAQEAVIVVVAVAYVVIGWRVRSPAAAAAVLAVSAVALALAASGMRPCGFELAFGVGLVLSGIGLRGAGPGATATP